MEWEKAQVLSDDSSLSPDEAQKWATDSLNVATEQGMPLDAAERYTKPSKLVDQKYSIVQNTMNEVARSSKAIGYNTAESWSEGFGSIANHLDHINSWMRGWVDKYEDLRKSSSFREWLPQEGFRGEQFFNNNEDFFGQVAKKFEADKEYYAQKAKEQGPSFLEELIGDATGGAAPGVSEFVFGVPYSMVEGASEAKEQGTSQIKGALTEAAKRLMLGKIFKGIEDYSRPIRASVMATVFGGQTAIGGGSPRDIAKAIGTGIGYGVAGPKGEIGIKDIMPEKASRMPVDAQRAEERPPEPPQSQEAKLIEKTKELSSPDIPISERAKNAVNDKYTTSKEAIGKSIEKGKNASATIFNDAKSGELFKPKVTDLDATKGEYIGSLQITGLESKKLAATIRKQFPDKLGREAIVNYIQANGDLAELQRMSEASTGKIKKGYERALKLTDDEKAFAFQIGQYFDAKLDMAQKAGMLEHGVENYVNQIWKSDNPTSKRLKSDIAYNKLQPNPSLTRKRIFQSYFEGEQAGHIPKNKDIGHLVTIYDQSFNRAIAARAFIKNIHELNASDGRPMVSVSGYSRQIDGTGNTDKAYLIKPRLKFEETSDYRVLDHPSLRSWKWAGKDADGNPIFLQGDLLVHPEAYNSLNNLLKTSALRQNKVGRAVLKTQATLKGTLLSLSGFHQTQIGIHAIFHKVNPFDAAEIDPTNPLQKALINNGVIVSDYKNMELFYEGMSGGGLVTKIPGLGTYAQKYTDWLFSDYIPRIKMKMAIAAHERNTERYQGKLTEQQILSLTADQANAAFGELNYAKMGRNPSFQDALRLGFLAPDFLEARTRFAAQSVLPYGREQAAALLRGAIGMYAAARIANYVLDDDFHWDKPFSLVAGKYELSLRSIPGDLYHLATDPRSFIYHRINPMLVKPIVEGLTSRDQYGRYRTGEEQLKDYITGFVPIPAQGLSDSQKKIWESALSSAGVSVYKSRSSFDKALTEKIRERVIHTTPPESRDRYALVNKYSDRWRDAIADKDKEAINKIKADISTDNKSGKLYREDVAKIIDYIKHDKLERVLKSATIEEVMSVWDKASKKEKTLYEPIVKEKIFNMREKYPERFKDMLPELKKVFKK
jgi:hypothetical protein